MKTIVNKPVSLYLKPSYFITILALLFFSTTSCQGQSPAGLADIKLRPGFSISYYAENVPGARSLTLGEEGTVFVGSMHAGNVYVLPDENGDGRADQVIVIASQMNRPNGVTFRDGSLYVAEINRVLRYDRIIENLHNPPDPVVVNDDFPTDVHHGWKFIAFGPDDKLYVPVGAPCNVCLKENKIYASITRMNPDGTGLEIFAHGIRNTVGFAWHPVTNELWFTDNGRDWLGDDAPPDELNHAPRKGMHFGFPYLHGSDVIDPDMGQIKDHSGFTTPVQELGAHVASLGMRFYTGDQFPDEYLNQIFIAEHGSWNRSTKIGYRVTLVRLNGNKAVSYEVFAEGWLQGEEAWGRPVDVLVMPDGALLVSDDRAGAVYRISYQL